jgi:hypothetical protein
MKPAQIAGRGCGCFDPLAGPRTRRELLAAASNGFGMLALASLIADRAYAEPIRTDADPARESARAHFAAKAKSVIFCFMDGGPSHVDTLDPKPMLAQRQGEQIGKSAVSTRSQSSPERVWLGSPWRFRQHGASGSWVSDLLPHIASRADDLCVVRSMVGIQPLHGQQNLLLHTGRIIGAAPSIGSWVSYGLGSENQNLPGYVVLSSDWVPNGGLENFSSSFLPATHQATLLRARGVPVDNITPSDAAAVQRLKLRLLAAQDAGFARDVASDGIDAAIQNYETAFRMQSMVPALADVSGETEATRRLYGLDVAGDLQRHYALQCLRARRLVEAGVRFVEVTFPEIGDNNNSPWDQHSLLKKNHTINALIMDQAVAALIADLKQRGLLDETIVLWAGEMGRTPHTPKISETVGRDHHVNGYSIFLAGGGFKGGTSYGATDEFGNSVVQDPVEIHDIHATILHQLGIDHKKLTFRYGGRDVSLTDVHGRVLNELLA